jgi:hypothetical protein
MIKQLARAIVLVSQSHGESSFTSKLAFEEMVKNAGFDFSEPDCSFYRLLELARSRAIIERRYADHPEFDILELKRG